MAEESSRTVPPWRQQALALVKVQSPERHACVAGEVVQFVDTTKNPTAACVAGEFSNGKTAAVARTLRGARGVAGSVHTIVSMRAIFVDHVAPPAAGIKSREP